MQARSVVTLVLPVALFMSGCGGTGAGEGQAVAAPAPETTNLLPPSPVTDRLVACMAEEGWPVERSWQGGIESGVIPTEQLGSYEAANARCSESSGWTATQSLSGEQVRELYRLELAEHECLGRLGIASNDPPTEQRYVDTYQTREQYFAFDPGFDALSVQQMQDAVDECPPPTWFLNLASLR